MMMLQARPVGDGAGLLLLPLAHLFHTFLIIMAAMTLLAGQAAATPLPSPQQPAGAGSAMGDELSRPIINGAGPVKAADNTVVPQPGGNPALQTDLPPAKIDEDTGQVFINGPATDKPALPALPIRATIFRGVPGPKACRGGAMTALDFGAGTALQHTDERCYDLPDTAGCGNFVANKADGCEARLFAERGCRMFVNLAVYQPDDRAVGGLWRSMAVRCGVPEPDPATLGAPPLAGMWSKKTSPAKGGRKKRSAAATSESRAAASGL